MLKFLKDKKKDNKGFTLVELVIVVAILAILVGILAPQYTKYVEKSRKAADAANLENLVTVIKTAAADASDSVPVDEYTILINKDGTSVTAKTATTTNQKTIETVVTEFAGDKWKKTSLKSSRWTNGEIKAVIDVQQDGKITVEYTPKDVTEQK